MFMFLYLYPTKIYLFFRFVAMNIQGLINLVHNYVMYIVYFTFISRLIYDK